jgi:Mlc titration factor MtfA (ptsG expression regulator)
MQVFIADKTFTGCGGIAITEAMRLTIAAQACLLIANRSTDVYPWLRAVLVYPASFVARHEVSDEAGVLTIEDRELSGESWPEGKVILAWADVRAGAAGRDDGNVVYHEFAHQLDLAESLTAGIPARGPLGTDGGSRTFTATLVAEYRAFCEVLDRGGATLLPEDAGDDPGEFFAVASEFFIERPCELAAERPALYALLGGYYRIDPAAWP